MLLYKAAEALCMVTWHIVIHRPVQAKVALLQGHLVILHCVQAFSMFGVHAVLSFQRTLLQRVQDRRHTFGMPPNTGIASPEASKASRNHWL